MRFFMLFVLLLPELKAYSLSQELKHSDHSNDIITISQCDLANNDAAFEWKLIQGAKDGIFYIEMPEKCKALIIYALDFGNSFYKDEALKNRTFPGFSGYHNREHVQVESFYGERSFWKELFSAEVNQLAREMNLLIEDLLKKTLLLLACGIAANQLGTATGKVTDNGGEYYFLFNHYRPEKTLTGLVPHKDTGFITLLGINKSGLIAKLHDVWGTILPKENYFIVNFGSALEILVNDTNKVTAVLHAVEHITDQDGRVSFGLSTEGSPESPLYALSANGSLEVVYASYQLYIEEFFKKTYSTIDQE